MRVFSDFRIFERPSTEGTALFRWIAWRWLFLGAFVACFILVVAAMHFIGGEPIYYKNEDRNLTDTEVWEVVFLFLSVSGLFAVLGFLGVLFIPKR